MESPKRAAVYIRVSTSKQEDEGTSLDTQEARCRAFCAERGDQVVGLFSDVYTGAKYRERPGLSALRERVRAGEVDVVVAYALDRLSRNQAHLAILAEEIEDHGAQLAFVTEDFEDSAVGRFIRSAKSFAAEIEREKIAERTARGRLARVQSGKLIPGPRPLYGYRWRDEAHAALDVDDATARVVRRIFAEALGGKALRAIAAGLNAEGVPSPKGGRWGASTVHHILYNHNYTGEAAAFGWRANESPTKRFDHTTAVALPAGTVPALIDRAGFDAIAGQLARNKAESIRNAANPEAGLLRAGYAVCGLCGRAMRVKTSTRQAPVYLCTAANDPARPCRGHGIAAPILDADVWTGLRERLLDRDRIARELERLRREDPTRADAAAIDRRLAEIAREQQSTARSVAKLDDDDAAAPLHANLKALAAEKRRLEADREGLERQRAAWQQAQHRLAELDVWMENARLNLGDIEADYAKKRFALHACRVRVRVWPTGHAQRWEATAELGGEPIVLSASARCTIPASRWR
jgi:site-specific DNA recombinase